MLGSSGMLENRTGEEVFSATGSGTGGGEEGEIGAGGAAALVSG